MSVHTYLFGDDARILYDVEYQLLLLASIIGAMGIVLVSPLLERLTTPFGITTVHAGLLVTAYVAPAVIAVPVAGWIADTYGRRPVLVFGLLIFGVAGSAITLTTNYRVILALRALQGLGSAGVVPIVITSIGDRYSDDKEATAQGLRITAVGAVQSVVPIVAAFLVGLAWQFPFLLYALAIPTAILIGLLYTDPTHSDDASTSQTRGYVRDIFGVLRRPRVIASLVALPMPIFVYISFLTYNSFLIVRVLDGSSGDVGLLLGLVNGMYGASASQAGRASKVFGQRETPIMGAFVLLGGGMSLFAQSPSLLVAAGGCVVMATGAGLASSLLFSSITALAPTALRGGLVSVSQMVLRFTMTVTPVVVGGVMAYVGSTTGEYTAIRGALVFAGGTGALIGLIAIGTASAVNSSDQKQSTDNEDLR